jgi:5-methylcytosine-specific restriction endonuclease McrA
MQQGKAPTVKRGPYAGDQLSVDHIIPRSVAPELDNVIANLELMPQRMNAGKGNRVGERQVDLARKFHKAGLLSAKGLMAVEKAKTERSWASDFSCAPCLSHLRLYCSLSV